MFFWTWHMTEPIKEIVLTKREYHCLDDRRFSWPILTTDYIDSGMQGPIWFLSPNQLFVTHEVPEMNSLYSSGHRFFQKSFSFGVYFARWFVEENGFLALWHCADYSTYKKVDFYYLFLAEKNFSVNINVLVKLSRHNLFSTLGIYC